jgi:hypothetical protein
VRLRVEVVVTTAPETRLPAVGVFALHVTADWARPGGYLVFAIAGAGYGCNRTNAPRINSARPKQIWMNFIRIC